MSAPAWYYEWAAKHCVAFGFADKQADTVLAWGPKFAHLFTPDELHAATEHLTGREDVPKWAADHRGLILTTVRHLRRKAADRPRQPGYADGVCIECGGPGLVLVPHPGLDEFGQWRAKLSPPSADPDGERSATRNACVCCILCEKGRATRENSVQASRPLMTVTEYERRYPRWRDVADARAALAGAADGPPTPEQAGRLKRELDAYRRAERERQDAA